MLDVTSGPPPRTAWAWNHGVTSGPNLSKPHVLHLKNEETGPERGLASQASQTCFRKLHEGDAGGRREGDREAGPSRPSAPPTPELSCS